MGYECPEIYGDPAVLTPQIYEGTVKHRSRYIVIPHYSKMNKYSKTENIVCTFSRN